MELTDLDVVPVAIPFCDLEMIETHARNAILGGRSEVRNPIARKEWIVQDQLVGCLVNYAAISWLFDSTDLYKKARAKADADPWKGDGGQDIPGYPIDVKGTLMRYGVTPLKYHLAVRPRDVRPNWVYVLGLVDRLTHPITVSLTGWATQKDLPTNSVTNGTFAGAHLIPAKQLKAMSRLKSRIQKKLRESVRDY